MKKDVRIKDVKNLQTDIVIIGMGGTGLAAAVAALEKGAKVLVLEKAASPGGSSAMAVGFFAAESPVQKRWRVDAPRDILFKMAMDFAHWTINPRIIRAFIDKSGDTVRWLEEKGLEIEFLNPFYPNQIIVTEHDAKKGGSDVVRILLKTLDDLGGRVLTDTSAKKIVMSTRGEVQGVLAVKEGKDIKITARSVIIATGGYAANTELVKKFSPWYTEEIPYRGLPHMGEGLLMALEVGAATDGLGQLRMLGPMYQGARRYVGIIYEQPNTIWVNRKGERFADETIIFNHFESVNAIVRQPGKVSYTLFDEQIKRDIIEKGPVKVRQRGFFGRPEKSLTDLSESLRKEAEEGKIKVAASWDEIARWIGADPEVLKATVDEYNSSCERGHDHIFAKDRRYLIPLRTPPYYAMMGRAGLTTTQGGIKINHHMEVLNAQDDPIPGLYAGGDATGGWEPQTYNAHLSGSGLGFALNSGRIAGENAANYVQA